MHLALLNHRSIFVRFLVSPVTAIDYKFSCGNKRGWKAPCQTPSTPPVCSADFRWHSPHKNNPRPKDCALGLLSIELMCLVCGVVFLYPRLSLAYSWSHLSCCGDLHCSPRATVIDHPPGGYPNQTGWYFYLKSRIRRRSFQGHLILGSITATPAPPTGGASGRCSYCQDSGSISRPWLEFISVTGRYRHYLSHERGLTLR